MIIILLSLIDLFFESPLVVMLIFGLTSLDLLIMLFISTILLDNIVRNISLISLMLIFKAYVYGFLLLIGKANLLLFDFAGLREGLDLGT